MHTLDIKTAFLKSLQALPKRESELSISKCSNSLEYKIQMTFTSNFTFQYRYTFFISELFYLFVLFSFLIF